MDSGRTPVESTESEFSAVGRPKRVKNRKRNFTPSSEEKYSLRVKIFEFYPSGCTPVESTES